MLATMLAFIRKDYLCFTGCGVTTWWWCFGTQAKERERSHFLASGYFNLRFPQIRSVCLRVCLSDQSLAEKLTLSCVV